MWAIPRRTDVVRRGTCRSVVAAAPTEWTRQPVGYATVALLIAAGAIRPVKPPSDSKTPQV